MHFIKILIVVIASVVTIKGHAQSGKAIPLAHTVINEEIDKQQKAILKVFKSMDSGYNSPKSEELNSALANAAINKIDSIQNYIETGISFDEDKKTRFLKGLKKILDDFEYACKTKELTRNQLSFLIDAYHKAMDLDVKDSSILPVIQENGFVIGGIIIKSLPFKNIIGIQESKEVVVLKAYQEKPAQIFSVLFDNWDVSFADSLVRIAAREFPDELYTYSQATSSPLGKLIEASNDPLVKLIAQLAKRRDGRLFFPFLANLLTGKITMTEISKTFGDKNNAAYFSLMVHTQIDYTERMQKGDTPVAGASLMERLKKRALDDFINVINGLHDRPDNIRLKVLAKLDARDLYYLCIAGSDELYTSSYLRIYDAIFKRLKFPDGYTLLESVHFDHFKRFIKMASNFNTLDNFLKRMKKEDADFLMRSFVSNLQNTNDLEDAVDVADSYASIQNSSLRKLIATEVQKNLAQSGESKNVKGSTIYGLLDTLFLSTDPANNIEVSAALGIRPVYQLNIDLLKDPSGKIIIQQFFYGDKDGINEFNNFLKAYNNPKWKIIRKDDWVEVHSIKGSAITIYTNIPLNEITSLDVKAQVALGKYLDSNNLRPTVVIHRGHSYYVRYTLEQLAPSAQLVLLGSCGGYNNLSRLIETCPYVHIIATKQEGSGSINLPMIVYITELLREGENLKWPEIWKQFRRTFKADKRFEDYIPPYQNLGAIFIMAFNKAMESRN